LPNEGSYSARLLGDALEAGLFTDVVQFTAVNDMLEKL
jgi:hypothetical protein